ncbi:MAG TPA: hypothetical protein VLK22_04690 [Candidatus Udaeobacter sp.]|nr:hypothetical protein [Candidatus Udaeobacter sp.]
MFEATEYEQLCLKEKFDGTIGSWEGAGSSTEKIGTFHEYDIMVHVSWVRINGGLVGFFRTTSQVVNNVTVEEWVESCLRPGKESRSKSRQANPHNFRLYLSSLGRT